MANVKDLQCDYPLHLAVFQDDYSELNRLLKSGKHFLEKIDYRGRTPLLLAVTIGRKDCAELLLKNGASTLAQDRNEWSFIDLAVSLGDREFLSRVLSYVKYDKSREDAREAVRWLEKLQDATDYFVRIDWTFNYSMPFMNEIYKPDQHEVYKEGSSLRIDFGYWLEGDKYKTENSRSITFRLIEGGAQIVEYNHDARKVLVTDLLLEDKVERFIPTDEEVDALINSPSRISYMDLNNVGFVNQRTFLSRFRGGTEAISSNWSETLDGYRFRIVNATNIEIVDKRRIDHLSPAQRDKWKKKEKLDIFSKLVFFAKEKKDESTRINLMEKGLTLETYFDPDHIFSNGTDVGVPREILTKNTTGKGTFWIGNGYRIFFHEHVAPVFKLMSKRHSYYKKVNSLFQMQMPFGFPIKSEVQIQSLITARVEFTSLNKKNNQFVHAVESMHEPHEGIVKVHEIAWKIPEDYTIVKTEEDLAISREDSSEDALVQQAIGMSLEPEAESDGSLDTDFYRAIRDSQVDTSVEVRRREEEQFQAELKHALELSKMEK